MGLDPTPSIDFFKDVGGRWRTVSLFVELADQPDKYPPVYTLGDEDKEVDGVKYISVKRKYLEYLDPMEHDFATSIFGSYACWEQVCQSTPLKPHIEQWRKELDLKLKGMGIHSLTKAMMSGDVNAAKWFAEGRWKEAPTKRGRPSKEEVQRERVRAAREDTDHKDVLRRLGVVGPDKTKAA